MKQSKNTLGLLGAAVVGSLLLGNSAFAVEPMSHGYQLAAAKTDAEGKCGEGKCGGSEKAGKAEGKCGGEGKAGKAEGKCGEGKCGASEKQAGKAKS